MSFIYPLLSSEMTNVVSNNAYRKEHTLYIMISNSCTLTKIYVWYTHFIFFGASLKATEGTIIGMPILPILPICLAKMIFRNVLWNVTMYYYWIWYKLKGVLIVNKIYLHCNPQFLNFTGISGHAVLFCLRLNRYQVKNGVMSCMLELSAPEQQYPEPCYNENP